jgi:hypothetical protein
MKNSKRKSVSKSSATETKCDCTDCVTVGAAILTLVIIAAIVGLIYYTSGPKYEEGDCLLNRVGETLEVEGVSKETYKLAPQKYVEGMFSYFAVDDWNKDAVWKDVEFVDENYIEVPCSR